MKKLIINFNNSIKKTIFKVQNKTNNNFKISNFNKYLIIFIGLLFFYLFYLLIPLFYDKNWVQSNIENKILQDFKINISTSSNFSYRILPSPHFLMKDSIILIEDDKKLKSIAEIKLLKIFLSQGKFLDKKKMNIKKVIIENANFSLSGNEFKLLIKSSNNQFSKKKIEVYNSNIFFKDHSSEVISIVKMNKALLFFDDKKLLNLFSLKGETYALPFDFSFSNENNSVKNKEINFNAESLKLNIFNKSVDGKNKSTNGKNIIKFLNSAIITQYYIKNKLIIFTSDNSKIKNSKIIYNGELSINPFDLNLNINLDNYKIFKLFNINNILIEFIKSGLLFNENISVNTSILANSNIKNEIFQNAKINFNIVGRKINLNNTKFINDKIGSLKLNNSDLFLKNNNLVLNTDIVISIDNLDKLFSFLNTNKLSRKKIKNILINLDYNFSTNQIHFNKVEIDKKKVSDKFLKIIDGFNDNNFNNLNKSRVLINKMFDNYDG